MPSFQKVLKAKSAPHRERSQPADRKQLGFLQKKKDYKIRAEKNREKEKAIKVLHQKALERNPDEFCYNMITQSKQRLKSALEVDEDDDYEFYNEGDIERKVAPVSIQERKFLNRDVNYVNWKLQIEKKKVEKLKNQLKLSVCDRKSKKRHIFFTETGKSAKSSKCNLVLHTDKTEIDKLQANIDTSGQRVKELRVVYDKLNVQKDLYNNTEAAKVLLKKDGENHAALYKWRPMRKK